MSCDEISDSTQYSSDENIEENEFVILNEFPKYVIQKDYPHVIKNIKTGHEMKPYLRKDGYFGIRLSGKNHLLHRVIAKQFIPNPNGYKFVDHISRDKTDNHLSNLRFCTHQQNTNNRSNNIIVNEIPEDAIEVDEYNNYTFENLYFSESTNKFYFDSGIDFIERKPIKNSKHSYYIMARDINNNKIKIYYNKFKREYNLI